VGDFPQEGLPQRFPAAERVEPDGVSGQIHLRPNEAVAPGRIHGEGMPQEGDGPIVARSAQEDEAALRNGGLGFGGFSYLQGRASSPIFQDILSP